MVSGSGWDVLVCFTGEPGSRVASFAAGREAKLAFIGHAAMENRNGLAVAGNVNYTN